MPEEKRLTVKVFTYGTLKVGECREGVLEKEEVNRRRAVIMGFDLYHLGSFPCIVPNENGGRGQVFGEVVECTDPKAVVRRLDRIEGYSRQRPQHSLYIRQKVEVIDLANGKKSKAFVYVFGGARIGRGFDRKRVESGNWKSKDFHGSYAGGR